MKLVDYFAGRFAEAAFKAILDENHSGLTIAIKATDIAKMAYDLADAMVAERQRRLPFRQGGTSFAPEQTMTNDDDADTPPRPSIAAHTKPETPSSIQAAPDFESVFGNPEPTPHCPECAAHRVDMRLSVMGLDGYVCDTCKSMFMHDLRRFGESVAPPE